MPKPRADFECKPCGKKAGTDPVVHENLPVSSVFCPYSGKRRGFKRLFDSVQVSTAGHRVARYIDKRLRPQADLHAAEVAKARNFEKKLETARDKTWESASPAQRAQLAPVAAPGVPLAQHVSAAAAFSSIDPAARRDSAAYTYPMIKRQVVPLWERAR